MFFLGSARHPQFHWTVHPDHAVRVSTVVASGELDLAAADKLETTLARQYRVAREIRVDLSRVRFLDAAILGVLARADQDMRAREGRLVITGAGYRTRRLLRITGLMDLLAADRVAQDDARRATAVRTSPAANIVA